MISFAFGALCLIKAIQGLGVSTEKEPPVLPLHFNATLLKIGTESSASPSRWTKTYYAYNEKKPLESYHRFDFYDHYLNLDNKWNMVCSIIFRDGVTYSLFPTTTTSDKEVVRDVEGKSAEQQQSKQDPECYMSHSFLPVLAPNWLQGAVFEGVQEFRGVQAEKWRLGEVGDGDTVYEYSTTATALDGQQLRIPLRTTNQANDPGATDWFDFTIGPQSDALFQLPKSCQNETVVRPDRKGCPPDFDEVNLIFQH
ncbi:hypothetical protein MIR68_010764 [Amoeboaphelidium protococcarum]|nr:hypothetical protein MIR68_010764 [Amoeboaphelidium protococcarum]KAI3642235.1 hypothetical protein MP228_011790 [Amoeboaphelidium protococcarum]